jgi:hypothetical protein
MLGGERTADRDSGDPSAPQDDPYLDWRFGEVNPGSYSVHAFVLAAGTDEQVVGLSGVDSVEVVPQTDLRFVVDGESKSTVLSNCETVSYTATTVFEGTTEDITDEVAVDVSIGDGRYRRECRRGNGRDSRYRDAGDDGERTDSVGVTVESGPQTVEFEIDGQSGSVTLQASETAP